MPVLFRTVVYSELCNPSFRVVGISTPFICRIEHDILNLLQGNNFRVVQGRSPNSLDFPADSRVTAHPWIERHQLLQALYIASIIVVNSKLYRKWRRGVLFAKGILHQLFWRSSLLMTALLLPLRTVLPVSFGLSETGIRSCNFSAHCASVVHNERSGEQGRSQLPNSTRARSWYSSAHPMAQVAGVGSICQTSMSS